MYDQYRKDFSKYRRNDLCSIQQHLDFIWRKRYEPLIIFVTSIIILSIIFIELLTKNSVNLEASQKIYDVILTITGAIIFWYSRETADLKDISNKSIKELRKQIFLEQRPFIRLQWINDDGIRIINEGFGIAATKSYTDAGFEDAGLSNAQEFLDIFKPSDGYKIDVRYSDVAGNKYSQIFIANIKLNDKYELLEWDLPVDFERTEFKRIKTE
jgi:hypothetical protein